MSAEFATHSDHHLANTKNDDVRYGIVAMAFHWTIAALVVINIVLGIWFVNFLDRTDAVRPAIATLADKLSTVAWEKIAIASSIKEVLAAHALKMPALAMPVRVLVMGTSQTPSLDAVLALFSRETILKRLKEA